MIIDLNKVNSDPFRTTFNFSESFKASVIPTTSAPPPSPLTPLGGPSWPRGDADIILNIVVIAVTADDIFKLRQELGTPLGQSPISVVAIRIRISASPRDAAKAGAKARRWSRSGWLCRQKKKPMSPR